MHKRLPEKQETRRMNEHQGETSMVDSPSPLISKSLSLVIAACMHMGMRLTARA